MRAAIEHDVIRLHHPLAKKRHLGGQTLDISVPFVAVDVPDQEIELCPTHVPIMNYILLEWRVAPREAELARESAEILWQGGGELAHVSLVPGRTKAA